MFGDLLAPLQPSAGQVRITASLDGLDLADRIAHGLRACLRRRTHDVDFVVVRDDGKAVRIAEHPQRLRHSRAGELDLPSTHRSRAIDHEGEVHRGTGCATGRLRGGEGEEDVPEAVASGADKIAIGLDGQIHPLLLFFGFENVAYGGKHRVELTLCAPGERTADVQLDAVGQREPFPLRASSLRPCQSH